MSSSSRRAQLVEHLVEVSRVHTLRAVMFHQAAAQRVGLTVNDLNCINILGVEGPMSPGQLAERVGLTRGGAITAAIDRLEEAGHLRRTRDPHDRRRVVLELVPESVAAGIAPPFAGVVEAWERLLDDYSDDELECIVDFKRKNNEFVHKLTLRLQGERAQ
jgi:DNA-binding MarR family transcriptional regulator